MKDRRDRLARVADISQTLWRLHQTRLAQREAELSEIAATTKDAFDAVALIEPLVALQRIGFLTQRRREAEDAIDALRGVAREFGARAKLADRTLRQAEIMLRREEAAADIRRLSSLDVSAPKGR